MCSVCPLGTTPSTDGNSCVGCGSNQQLVGGQCVCVPGTAFNSARVCTPCASITNGFILNNFCSVCPNGMTYNGNGSCTCPSGQISQGGICTSQCQPNELVDSYGNCYTCAINQVISNDKCVCATGYTLGLNGFCAITCTAGQFPFQGGCATCPLNTVFRP